MRQGGVKNSMRIQGQQISSKQGSSSVRKSHRGKTLKIANSKTEKESPHSMANSPGESKGKIKGSED